MYIHTYITSTIKQPCRTYCPLGRDVHSITVYTTCNKVRSKPSVHVTDQYVVQPA